MTKQQLNLGEAALIIAIGELGNGEEERNNHGFHIRKYRRGIPIRGGGAWCAQFVSYCIEEAWSALGKKSKHLKIQRSSGATRLSKNCEKYGTLVELNDVQPGDIVLWKSRVSHHINIVHDVTHEQQCVAGVPEQRVASFRTIDGNKGPFPAKVALFEHDLFPKPVRIVRLP